MKKQKHYLEEILWPPIQIVEYRGCLVTRIIGGYQIFGKTVVSAGQVDEVIDRGLKSLGNSISDKKSQNGGAGDD